MTAKSDKKTLHREYMRDWRKRPEIRPRVNKYQREYCTRPYVRARINAYNQRPDVRAKNKAYAKRWRKLNKDKLRAYQRAYLQSPLGIHCRVKSDIKRIKKGTYTGYVKGSNKTRILRRCLTCGRTYIAQNSVTVHRKKTGHMHFERFKQVKAL